MSPHLHRAALASAGLQGEYLLYPVENTRSCHIPLKRLIQRVRMGQIHGLNVTIPHKQHVIDLVDDLTGTATAIGAVNTIYMKDSLVIGDNTDAPGFLHDLQNHAMVPPDGQMKTALVLGAGGSARAVVYALVSTGWVVTVASRRSEQSAELLSSFITFADRLQSLPMERVETYSQNHLIVNCTPLGMDPHLETTPWPEGLPFPAEGCIYDLVYAPRETRLVRAARSAGLQAANGLGMLVEQAALAFERWTGHPADRAAMKAAVE